MSAILYFPVPRQDADVDRREKHLSEQKHSVTMAISDSNCLALAGCNTAWRKRRRRTAGGCPGLQTAVTAVTWPEPPLWDFLL